MIKLENMNLSIPQYVENVYCLDNFSAFAVIIKGREYKTSEHAFQSIKFFDTAPEIAEMIKNSLSPFEARELAHKYKPLRNKNWGIVKYDIMKDILCEKAKQNLYVKEKLLATLNNKIIEDCGEDDDKDWGCGIDGTGENNLGKIWMEIRKKLFSRQSKK